MGFQMRRTIRIGAVIPFEINYGYGEVVQRDRSLYPCLRQVGEPHEGSRVVFFRSRCRRERQRLHRT